MTTTTPAIGTILLLVLLSLRKVLTGGSNSNTKIEGQDENQALLPRDRVMTYLKELELFLYQHIQSSKFSGQQEAGPFPPREKWARKIKLIKKMKKVFCLRKSFTLILLVLISKNV